MLREPGRDGEDGIFDPATVIGVRSDHDVLVLGNPAFMPWLTRENKGVIGARKINEAVALAKVRDFDRVILGREYGAGAWPELLASAVALNTRRGLLAYFPRSEGESWTFMQNLEFVMPLSRVWESNTTFGRVIMAELIGGYERE